HENLFHQYRGFGTPMIGVTEYIPLGRFGFSSLFSGAQEFFAEIRPMNLAIDRQYQLNIVENCIPSKTF
ncbi:MAG: hypothetical protein ACRCVA_03515, partial [Phreatobacter sp.]